MTDRGSSHFDPAPDEALALLRRYEHVRHRRHAWESHWQECYDFALPQRSALFGEQTSGAKHSNKLFDATAADAVDQLAASLLAELVPPWSRWFSLEGGVALDDATRAEAAPALEDIADIIRLHFDRSTFAVDVHQCFLDLATIGTAVLLFEEAAPGEPSAFRFTAIPMTELTLEEGPSGRLETVYRHFQAPWSHVQQRFASSNQDQDPDTDPLCPVEVLEAVEPHNGAWVYTALLLPTSGGGASGNRSLGNGSLGNGSLGGMESAPRILYRGTFSTSPFVCFRWLKAPGEAYGRSPVMKALPDIKTVNKVVELVLKNASIAVTGIWMAEEDGILNPGHISLTPGTIIPKAPGSKGLVPLQAPGRFDVSQLVLDDLRSRIRHALLVDRLGQINSPRMTATEVLERSQEMARVLGATYGRLQAELLTPLVLRAVAILRRRGEIPKIRVDGRGIEVRYTAPLARQQAREDARNAMMWLDTLRTLGPDALGVIDVPAVARWLGRALGVPSDLLTSDLLTSDLLTSDLLTSDPQTGDLLTPSSVSSGSLSSFGNIPTGE